RSQWPGGARCTADSRRRTPAWAAFWNPEHPWHCGTRPGLRSGRTGTSGRVLPDRRTEEPASGPDHGWARRGFDPWLGGAALAGEPEHELFGCRGRGALDRDG